MGVSPTPEKHVVALQNGNLTERIYPRDRRLQPDLDLLARRPISDADPDREA